MSLTFSHGQAASLATSDLKSSSSSSRDFVLLQDNLGKAHDELRDIKQRLSEAQTVSLASSLSGNISEMHSQFVRRQDETIRDLKQKNKVGASC